MSCTISDLSFLALKVIYIEEKKKDRQIDTWAQGAPIAKTIADESKNGRKICIQISLVRTIRNSQKYKNRPKLVGAK